MAKRKFKTDLKTAVKGLGYRVRWNDGGDGGTDGGDDGKTKVGETVSKADFDALQAKYDVTEKDLTDVRGEVLSDEYLAFLKTQGDDKTVEVKKVEVPGEADLDKMSKKEIFELATKAAESTYQKGIDDLKLGIADDKKSATAREVERFAKLHEDYNQYRPVMYGLSTDPKNEKLGLQELYDAAKEHVKGISGTTEKEKVEQRGMHSEKPGNFSASFEKDKIKSAGAATKEAVDEVTSELGPLPSA